MSLRAPFLTLAFISCINSPSTAKPRITETHQTSSTHDLIRHLLHQDLGTRTFPFPDVIFASSGKTVTPLNLQLPAHQTILNEINRAARKAIAEFNASNSPVRKLSRINEASRYFEDHLRKNLNTHPALTCSIPQNTQGHKQRSGYPDLLITHTTANGATTHAYLDPKIFAEKSQASSLRSFYFEPRTRTLKIHHHAIHLLLGISHDGKDGAWTFSHGKIADLSALNVRLKVEFQASNRDLYHPKTTINPIQRNP
ncbi:MAG: hypothetical protein KJO21_01585 [Verrucomicrobiae bacterium]|nr:hypothetical protein [Verrucomicrobiae bacterium]NNJ42227.1 hypothetical protein [Akkermansiaceae bacterium]